MTVGEKLKNRLGLSKIQNVSICRVLVSAIPIYLVYYSSSSPNMPITTYRVRNSKIANIFNGADVEHNKSRKQQNIIPAFAPLMPIEQYGGNLAGIWFITVDLAGLQLVNSNLIESETSFVETVSCSWFGKLDEITLFDLKQAQDTIVSNTTKNYRQIRQKLNKGANYNTKLISCEVQDKDIIFKFLSEATDNDDKIKKTVSPEGEITVHTGKATYELWLKFIDAIDFLDLQDKETIGLKEIKNIIQSCDVQLWSDDMSYTFQGFRYWGTQLDAAIFPNNQKPKRWNLVHGQDKVFLTKHYSQLIKQISFFINPMASMLDKYLRDKGLLPSKKK